jgi:hypothetical protein
MFVDRDANGNIIGQYVVQQRPGQEQVADNDPELLLSAGKAVTRAAIDAQAARLEPGTPKVAEERPCSE